MARCAIYTRVSTRDQNADLQVDELRQFAADRGFDVVGIYKDQGVSGKNTKRPEFSRMMSDARKGKFEVVLCWKFDRFSRSLRDLVNHLAEFKALNVDFISKQDGQDTTTPGGKLLFHIFAAIAEFERSVIGERTSAGMQAAKRRGRVLGRKAVPVKVQQQVHQLRQGGLSFRAIAKATGTSLPTVVKYAKGGDQPVG